MEADTGIKDRFNSIAGPSEGLFKDKGSRFIALAYPVDSEEKVKAIVTGLKKEYHDARHHCYAYRIGHLGELARASDDGEPSGTAGRQILGQIDSAGLSDILIVVVRYFGGIKLGVPGLIRAYKSASADAIASAELTEKTATRCFRLRFDYLCVNSVMKVLKDMGVEPSEQRFDNRCSLDAKVRLGLVETFLRRIGDIAGVQTEEMTGNSDCETSDNPLI